MKKWIAKKLFWFCQVLDPTYTKLLLHASRDVLEPDDPIMPLINDALGK